MLTPLITFVIFILSEFNVSLPTINAHKAMLAFISGQYFVEKSTTLIPKELFMRLHRSLITTPLNEPATRILSAGSYLPKNIVKSSDLFEEIGTERLYDIPTNWMDEKMGIHERRVSEPGSKPSELAIHAARKAIDNYPEVHQDQIDMVIFCGIERDQSEPATAHSVQHALGLKARHAFDISNACFGFNDGIEIANNFIKSGSAKYALVVTGEVITKIIPSFIRQMKIGVSRSKAKNLIGWLSLGDAGGAMLIGPSEPGDCRGFKTFRNNIDSSHVDKCSYVLGDDGEYHGEMKMARIVAHGFRLHKEIINQTLSNVGWQQFDRLLTHQTGRKNFEQIAGLGIVEPKNMIKTYELLGNITTATLPLSCEKMLCDGTLVSGCRIGGCFGGSGLTTGQFCYQY